MLLLWALGLSLPGSAAGGLVALWGVLLLEEGWSWGRLRSAARWLRGPRLSCRTSIADTPMSAEAGLGQFSGESRDAGRSRRAGRSDFAADRPPATNRTAARRSKAGCGPSCRRRQRHATAHVAICPPFERPARVLRRTNGRPAGADQGGAGVALRRAVRDQARRAVPPKRPTCWSSFRFKSAGATSDGTGPYRRAAGPRCLAASGPSLRRRAARADRSGR